MNEAEKGKCCRREGGLLLLAGEREKGYMWEVRCGKNE